MIAVSIVKVVGSSVLCSFKTSQRQRVIDEQKFNDDQGVVDTRTLFQGVFRDRFEPAFDGWSFSKLREERFFEFARNGFFAGSEYRESAADAT